MITITLNDQFDFCADAFLETLAGRIVEIMGYVADENISNQRVGITLNITPIGAKSSKTVIVGGTVVKDGTDSRTVEEVELECSSGLRISGVEEVTQ